jgi:hypothetical protein
VCKTSEWSTASHVVNVTRYASDASALNAPTYPHILVTCKFCAHSMFFNAVQIGVTAAYVQPPPPQALGVAASDLLGSGGILGSHPSLLDLLKKKG